jgi:hypothetical protein
LTIADFYSVEERNLATPFMQRILERRNHIFKLMANTTEKQVGGETPGKEKKNVVSKEKNNSVSLSGRNIKQLIEQTLKNYDDVNDI